MLHGSAHLTGPTLNSEVAAKLERHQHSDRNVRKDGQNTATRRSFRQVGRNLPFVITVQQSLPEHVQLANCRTTAHGDD